MSFHRRQFLKAFFDEGGVLDAGQPRVKAVQGQQFGVRAALDDLTVPQYQDLIRLANGAQTMGDDEAGAVGHEAFQRLLDQLFRRRVHAGGRFIQNQDRRVLQQGARDADALLLAHA